MRPLPIVRAAVAEGVSLMCATCDHYWSARDAAVPGYQCSVKAPCVGPFAGGTFPEYRGPITDASRWCLRCGEGSVDAVRVAGTERAFGLCARHRKEALVLSPEGQYTHHLLEVIRPGVSQVVNMTRLPPRPGQQSVTEILRELDQEYSRAVDLPRAGG